MELEIVVAGHGEIGDKSILRKQVEYLKALRKEVKRYADEEASLEDTIKKAELPEFKGMEGYAQRFSRNVEAVWRELKEGR